MTARPAAPDGAGEVKSMDTSLGNRKLPRCCAPEPGNGDWTGADDSDPAGRKTVALPLPHAATPVRMPAASNAAAPRRPRMLPPWPPGLGDRTRVRPPAHRHRRYARTCAHPDPPDEYRTISTARGPCFDANARLFMAFSQARSHPWALIATLITTATVAAAAVRFRLWRGRPPGARSSRWARS